MRTVALLLIVPVVAVSLACGASDAPPPPPEPMAEPVDEGFGALFEREADAPRAPSGDTAEPAVAAPTPAPAAPDLPAAAETVAPTPAPVVAATTPASASSRPEPAPAPAPQASGSYRAVVAFYGGDAPEDFSAMVAALRTAAAPHGIQVVLAPLGTDSVAVEGGRVDIGAFRAARDAGFVFKTGGRQAVFAHYPPQTPVVGAASDYFGVTL